MPLPPKAELEWWYQYYFATERGRAGYEKYRARVCEAHLADGLAEVAFRRRHVRSVAKAFDNPDHVSIVIHNYRGDSG